MKNKKEALKSIGSNIQLARIKAGLTQAKLAEQCDVSTKYISAIERGITSGSIPLIIDICTVLNITPNYVFNNTIDLVNSNEKVNILSSETTLSYAKLKAENKSFIDYTIKHLYYMQKKR